MVLYDLTFAVELIALGMGAMMLVWAYRTEGVGIAVAKVFGYIITIAAAVLLLCTGYYATYHWKQGYFKHPVGQHSMMMRRQGMQQNNPMMQRRHMMRQRMMQQQQMMTPNTPEVKKNSQ